MLAAVMTQVKPHWPKKYYLGITKQFYFPSFWKRLSQVRRSPQEASVKRLDYERGVSTLIALVK